MLVSGCCYLLQRQKTVEARSVPCLNVLQVHGEDSKTCQEGICYESCCYYASLQCC